jgi:hypothetical protein
MRSRKENLAISMMGITTPNETPRRADPAT